jgi:hypothetical protein
MREPMMEKARLMRTDQVFSSISEVGAKGLQIAEMGGSSGVKRHS